MRRADIDVDSFLRDQEILEADAREALPYVCLHAQALNRTIIKLSITDY